MSAQPFGAPSSALLLLRPEVARYDAVYHNMGLVRNMGGGRIARVRSMSGATQTWPEHIS